MKHREESWWEKWKKENGGDSTSGTPATTTKTTQASATEPPASGADWWQTWKTENGAGRSETKTPSQVVQEEIKKKEQKKRYNEYIEEERKRKQARAELEQRRTATYTGSNPVARILDRGRAAVRNAAETTGLMDRADAEARVKDLDFYTRMYQDAARTGSQKLAEMAKKGYDAAYSSAVRSERASIEKAKKYQTAKNEQEWQVLKQQSPSDYYRYAYAVGREQGHSDIGYYTTQIDAALDSRDFTKVNDLLHQMTQAPLTPEERKKATSYIDDIYSREDGRYGGTSSGWMKDMEIGSYITKIEQSTETNEYGRLMSTDEGVEMARKIEQKYGVPSSLAFSDPDRYISEIRKARTADPTTFGGENDAAYLAFMDGRETWQTENANAAFRYRTDEEIGRAMQNPGSTGAQMDSFTRSYSAIQALDYLEQMVDNVDQSAGLDNYTVRYLLKELEGYGVSFTDLNDENVRERIRNALNEQRAKMSLMEKTLKQAGYDTDAIMQRLDYDRAIRIEQDRRESAEKWAQSASGWDKLAADLGIIAEDVYLRPIEGISTFSKLTAMSGGNTRDTGSYVPVAGQTYQSDILKGAISETYSPVGAFFYNALMSSAESTLGGLSLGEVGYLAAMGANAATSKAEEVLQRGGNRAQAAAAGITSGAIEILTETFSIENLIKIKEAAKSAASLKAIFKDLGKNVGISAFTEGSEELFGEVLDIMADALYMGNLSENSLEIQNLMAQGMSYSEALREVWKDNALQILESTAAGAVSGGFSTFTFAGAGAYQNARNMARYNAIMGGQLRAIGKQATSQQASVDAINQYAADSGLEVSELEAILSGAEAPTAETAKAPTEQTQATPEQTESTEEAPKPKTETRAERRQAMESGRTVMSVQENLTERMTQKGNVESAARVYAETVEKYGEGIRETADSAFRSAVRQLVTKSGSVGSVIAAARNSLSSIQDENVRAMAEEIVTQEVHRATVSAAVSGNKAQVGEGVKYLRTNGEQITMEAEIENGDGSTRTEGIVSLVDVRQGNKNVKGVLLTDGTRATIDELKTDAETKDVLDVMAASKMTEQASAEMLDALASVRKDGSVDTRDWASEYIEAYDRGTVGVKSIDEAVTMAKSLPAEIASQAYQAGQRDAGEIPTAQRMKMDELRKKVQPGATGRRGVFYADGVSEQTLNRLKNDKATGKEFRAQVEAMKLIAKATGVDIYLREMSQADAEGRLSGAQGSYKNGVIVIDVNAGLNNINRDLNRGLLAVTGHELTHWMKEAAPEAFADYRDAVRDALIQKEGSDAVDKLIDAQMAADSRITREEALEEVVADAGMRFIADESFWGAINESLGEDKHSIRQKIQKFIRDFFAKLREILGKTSQVGDAARIVDELEEAVQKSLGKLYAEGIRQASETWQQVGDVAMTDAKGNIPSGEMSSNLDSPGHVVGNLEVDANGNINRNSIRTIPKTEAGWDKLIQDMVSAGFDEDQAKSWIDDMRSVAASIFDAMQNNGWNPLDYESDPRSDWFRKNSGYPQGTIDFSNNCPRREEFTAQFDAAMKMLPNFEFDAQDYETLRGIIKDHGIPVPCGGCYVDERRQHLSRVGQMFIDQYRAALNGDTKNALKPKFFNKVKAQDKSYNLTLDDLVSSDGLLKLFNEHRSLYDSFMAFNNNRGMQSIRMVFGLSEYKGQIRKWDTRTINRKNKFGGIRMFSYSDADPRIVLDFMQIVTDAAAKKLMMQGYTKKPWFAVLAKDTGLRILRSHIPLGVGFKTVNGQKVLSFDDFEGIDTRDKYYRAINRDRDLNVGNNVIGINDTQIRLAMVSDMIDQIIPFHTGLKGETLEQKGLGHWRNYKDFQEDKVWSDGGWQSTAKAKNHINLYEDVLNTIDWSQTETRPDGTAMTDAERFVNRYLEVCRERGFKPRFAQFLLDENGDYVEYDDDHYFELDEKIGKMRYADGAHYTYNPGYEKFLVDFRLFDKTGKIIPQVAVQPNFNTEFIRAYFGEYVEDHKTRHELNEDVQNTFLAAMQSKYGDALDDGARRSSRVTAEEDTEYLELAKDPQKNAERLQEMVERAAEREFADSKMRTKDGKLRVLYHGTNTGDFTVFNQDYIGMSSGDDGFFGMGFYFAYTKGEASYFGSKRVISAYLDIKNPFNFETEIYTYNGQTAEGGFAPRAVAIINFAEKFPSIAKTIPIYTRDGKITAAEFSKKLKDVIASKEFKFEKIKDAYNGDVTLVTADPQEYSYTTPNGETDSWMDYGYQQKYSSEPNQIDVAVDYLMKQLGISELQSATQTILDNSRAFTKAVQDLGHDGVIQSEDGDEAVVFKSSQIKSADPVTYDDAGNPIPLSQRFNTENEDIRYSRRTTPDEGQIGMFGEDGVPVYQEQTKSVRDQFMEVYQELHDKYQNTKRWNGLEFDGLYAEHPEMDFVERFFQNDPKAKSDLQQFLETIDDADALEELKYFTTQNRSARQSDHAGAVRKVRNAYSKRIQELGGGNAISIDHRVYTQAEVRKLFDSMNSNPAVGDLAEKVFATAERLGIRYYGANHATGSTNFDGMSIGGDVFLKRSFFANKKYTDQQKAGTILHEVVHACTTYALRGEYLSRNTEQSRVLAKAADTLREIWRQAKQEDLLYGEYGLQDVYEFTAELANESFREKLKKVRLWDRVVDAIRRMFGIEKRTALDSASAALEYLLDNVDVAGARTYYREQEFAMRQWEASHDRLRYSMRDNDAPSDLDLLDGFSQNDAENEEQRRLLREAQESGKKLREAQRQLERLRADMQALAGDNPSRITIRDFRRNVLDLFGIPSSERNGDIGNMVQSIAEGVLAGATLNRDDISFFFQTFVESGTMRMEPDEYLAQIRDDLRGRRVYVDKQVRGDLGEDYAALRKRAFGLGITLTSNEKDMGIDQHFAELAEMYPGAFDSEELDLGTMLESMIDYAESGKASTVSVLDGMRQIEGQTGEPVRDQLQRMYDYFVRHIEIMEDRGKLEAKARAGNAAEIASAKAKAEKAKAELSKVRKERNEWKRKATSAEQRASDKLQAELRKIVKHDAAQLAEAVRQKEALAKKLQQQVEREQKILTGKLNTPQLAKMLSEAKRTAAAEARKAKDEVFARAKDRKRASELRGRIKNLSDEMKRRMTRPTDGAYLPASLYGSMTHLADVLDEFLAPNPGTKAAERYKAMLDGIRRMSSEYAAVADLDDPVYSTEYDAEIKADIDAIERTLTRSEQTWLDQLTGDTQKSIRELSTAELQHIYELMRSINFTMKNAAKSLSWNEGKSLYDAMRSVAEQQQALTPLEETGKYETSKRGRLLRKMSTMRAVEMMAGYQRDAALYQLMHGIEQGVVDSDSWVMNYDKAMQPLKNGKNELEYRKAISKKLDFGATTDRGTKVLMTKMQAIQILMTAEREAHNDKLVHLQKGGAVIRDKSSGKSYTIQVTPELLSRIQDRMTEWDKSYMKTIREYFGREGRATNEILYKLKHRVLQTEKYYVPYQVDKNYLETKLDSPEAAMSMWVKTPGSTNALAQKASQPVYIDGMDAVMGHHVREIANYIGLALAIRDFSKVYNGMLSQGDGENPLPVKETIFRNFGVDGQKLLTQAVIDIQGGRRGNQHRTGIGKFLDAMQSSFYKTALLINPSVTIKQAASYIAIESILDHRAVIAGNRPIFVKADKSLSPSLIAHIFASPSGATAMRLYNEIDAHTSMHYMRRQGMSMRELASQANRSGPIARAKGMVGASMEQAGWIGHKARQAAEAISPLNWIQRMDVATTAAVWVACKEQAKLDGIEVGTDEYWQHVTELYERCLRETQPMYDDLHRNEYQKDREGLMSYLFPFRTVPIQNHGQLANSFENMRAARKSGDKARMKAANRFFRKTVAAQTMSAAVFSVMTFLAAALKRKTKKYRDDDEEISAETIGIGIGKDVVGTLISVFAPLFGSTIWDTGNNVYDAVRTGKNIRSYDSFSVGVVDLLNELESKSKDLATDFAGLITGKDVDQDKFLDHVMAMVEAGAKCAGIPYTTIKTYSSGIRGNIKDITEGRIPALNDEAADRTNAVNVGRYWKAWVAGDDAKMNTVLNEMIQNYLDDGKDEEKAHELTRNALGSAVMDRYTEDELDLQELSDYMDGTGLWDDEKRQDKLAGIIRDEFQAGLRDEDETIDLLTDLCGWDEDKAWKKVKEWSAKAEHEDDEDYSYSQYDEIDEAIDANKDIGAIVKELTDHGVKAESIASHVKQKLIANYVAGGVTETALKNQLSRYCGITAKDDVEKILKDANSKKSYGVAYSSLDEEYRAGHISRTELVKALKQYGGLSDEDANKKIRWYDLQKKYPDMEITEAWSNHYYDGTSKTQENGHESASAAGMTIKQYVDAMTVLSKVTGTDANGDGKTDTNSKEVAYIAAIDAMNLTGAQKWALYYEVYKGANWKKIAKPNW